MSSNIRALHWFRRDLRVTDNTALQAATEAATNGVVAVFIITPLTWQQHDKSAAQVAFTLAQLAELKPALSSLNIPLLTLTVDRFEDVPAALKKLVKAHQIDRLYFNDEYEVDEQARDQAVVDTLASIDCKTFRHCDQLVAPPGTVMNKTNEPFKVFTPFSKRWYEWTDMTHAYQTVPYPKKQANMLLAHDEIPARVTGFDDIDLSDWPTGEKETQQRLVRFTLEKAQDYKKWRDFPAKSNTSRLSPYLAIGAISPRQCISTLQEALDGKDMSCIIQQEGTKTWLNELIWREFYKHTLVHFPDVCKHRAYRAHTEKLQWNKNDAHFKAWCDGRTGFPLVDAAMRQLKNRHWMHNRNRMVVAMFFSKILFLDWRLGEKFFMQHLIDGDLSANNGGWQWCASTGTDAVPYFRIFNPTTQSERFDPTGRFIRHYCPELAALDDKTIHNPYAKSLKPGSLDYPEPIIDYKAARAKTLAAFKSL